MKAHLVPLHHGGMDPGSARYCIRISGHLGVTLLSAFPALVCEHEGQVTVLTGVLDRSALYGVLADIEALGLDLIEVRQVGIEVRQVGPCRESPDPGACGSS